MLVGFFLLVVKRHPLNLCSEECKYMGALLSLVIEKVNKYEVSQSLKTIIAYLTSNKWLKVSLTDT